MFTNWMLSGIATHGYQSGHGKEIEVLRLPVGFGVLNAIT